MKKIKTIKNLIDFMLTEKRKTESFEQEIKSSVNPKYHVKNVNFTYCQLSGKEAHYTLCFNIQEDDKERVSLLWYYENYIEAEDDSSLQKEFYKDNKDLIENTLKKANQNIGSIFCASLCIPCDHSYSKTTFKSDDSHTGIIDFQRITVYKNESQQKKQILFQYDYDNKKPNFFDKMLLGAFRFVSIEITSPSIILQKAMESAITPTIDEDHQSHDNKIYKKK